MLAKNAQARGGQGAAQRGGALLAGLMFCRRCGRRMGVSYSGGCRSPTARYRCDAANMRHGAPKCISFSSFDVDAQVARQPIAIAQPGAVESAYRAWTNDGDGEDRALQALELQAEQARFEALRRTSIQRGRSGQSHRRSRARTEMECCARGGKLARDARRRPTGSAGSFIHACARAERLPISGARPRARVERGHNERCGKEAHRTRGHRTDLVRRR